MHKTSEGSSCESIIKIIKINIDPTLTTNKLDDFWKFYQILEEVGTEFLSYEHFPLVYFFFN